MPDAVRERLSDALHDRYLIERELGEGGAATVYLARDLRHERPVAIKVLRPDLAESLGADRFAREIRTAANLQHPHILTVYDSGVADGLPYYVMPFVEGESLRARLTREGQLPIADVVRILGEVADALAFAHAHGVVHRDIKPDNVLLSGKHALVADFGVAKAIEASQAGGAGARSAALTAIGIALGTPAYMAPEQATADSRIDQRADIYAFGVLGFELLTGEPPFVRRTPQQTIAAQLTEPAPRVASRRPATPPALDALIAKCLEKEPADRWQSADEIVAELERLATPAGTTAATASLPEAARPAVSPTKVKDGRLGMIVAGAAAIAVVAGFLFFKPKSATPADNHVVAVLPFEFSAAPDLAYLRSGIVDILESSLTGEGGPRAVASQTTIARWKRAGGADHGLTEEEARAIARDLGAGQLLRGSIVGTAAHLVISATLTSSARSGQEAVNAVVNGPADSIAGLAERLASQLLSLRAGEGAERLASLTSVPPPALRAYLEGQEALRAAKYSDAVDDFSRALSIDSTFALAAFSHAIAAGWDVTRSVGSSGTDIAFRHRDRLGPSDLTLLEMWTPSRFAGRELTGREVMALRERLVQKIPDRPEAWYLIGDAYFHSGRAYGFDFAESLTRAENAFRRALALDPGIVYIRSHLADRYLFFPDSLAHLPVVIDSLGLTSASYKLMAAIAAGDSTAVGRIAAAFPSEDDNTLIGTGFSASYLGMPAVSDSALHVALGRQGSADERSNTLRWAIWILLREGRPGAANALTARLERLDEGIGSQDMYAVYAAVFADGDTATAHRVAQGYVRTLDTPSRGRSAAVERRSAWVAGLWASFAGDSAGLTQSIETLDVLAARRDSTGEPQFASLGADVLRLLEPGPPSPAIANRADDILAQGPAVGSTDARGAMNLIVARTLERLGDARRAALAAERVSDGEIMYIMASPADRDQGRLYLAAGDTTSAIRAWRTYLAGRGLAEPPQRKADDAIRRKLDAVLKATR